ncbi:MAG: hypothetical protein RSE13_08325 [Planktothrix sp. GU0601_MAG3]|nr:MAG: hypothetical protein RSE13_08325 [Planktothrix sp. GU0601_MAG3]
MPFYTFLNGAWWYVGLIVQLYFVFPSRLFEFVLGIVLAIALLEQNSGSDKLLNWSQNLLFKRRWLGFLIL